MRRKTITIAVIGTLLGVLVFGLPRVGQSKIKFPEPVYLPRIADALENIYVAILALQNEPNEPQVPTREGLCKYLHVPTDSNEVICTVPAGERFVLLKLYCTTNKTDWSLTVDDNVLIDGHINSFAYERETNLTNHHYYSRYMHDFPDGCIVVQEGQTLKAVVVDSVELTIIGYFEDL